MQTTVNPHRFLGQEFVLCPLARGQSAVTLGGLRIGRVSHATAGEGKSIWHWSLTGPHCEGVPQDVPMCGQAAGLAEAKLQLRHAFDCWLRWAVEQDGPVHWHWTEASEEKAQDGEGGGRIALAS